MLRLLPRRYFAAGPKVASKFRRKTKSDGKKQQKAEGEASARSFRLQALKYRPTFVTLERSSEQMNEQARVIAEAMTRANELEVRRRAAEFEWIRQRVRALKLLPPHLQASALEWRREPAPFTRLPWTETPPLDDYTTTRSYSKKTS